MQVKEVSELSGVIIRTLHHWNFSVNFPKIVFLMSNKEEANCESKRSI